MMQKKIKFIRANKTKFGGAEVYLSRLSAELKKLNVSHDLVYSSIPKFLPSWFRVFLFDKQVCKNKKDNFYFSLERISCPDIYRAGDGVHKVFLSVEKKSKTNLLHKVYLSLEKKCFKNAKKIIANSHMIKNQIINTYDISPSKIEVIYNGINLVKPDFKKSFEKLTEEFNIKKDEKIFLYVGSGFQRKGVEEFLEILSKIKNENCRAFIIGKEKKITYYKELAQKLNIDTKVVFTGPRTDVADFYTISDIFLFPTRYEPFSNVILEAMSFSNVVITTKQNGAHEILKSEFVMNTSKDFSIINKINKIINNKEVMNKIKAENIIKVQDFSIEKNVEQTLKVINEVIN